MPKLSDTRFTDKFLAGLKVEPGGKDRMTFDAGCRGLGVRISASGTRTFIAQWTDPATKRKVRDRIGVWGQMTIAQAREAVQVRLGSVGKGINPRVQRERERSSALRERAEAALTFEALIEEWKELHLAHRRPRYAAEAERAIRLGLADLLKRPAARISRTDAVNALDRIVKAGKAVTAGRTMAYARACFAWGKRRGKIVENPFAELPIGAGTVDRERVLDDDEIRTVWDAAGKMNYPFGAFYRLATLTLKRREEVAGMRWSEIDLENRVWTIPGARMKNGKLHDVHLSDAAAAILREIPRIDGCDLVLTTGRRRTGRKDEPAPISGFSQGKRYLDAAIAKIRKGKPAADWRLHDLRRTGVTHLARLGFDSIVVDKLLAHQPTKLRGVAAVYQRHDFARERAAALDAWAAHVTRIATDNVIPLRGASR